MLRQEVIFLYQYTLICGFLICVMVLARGRVLPVTKDAKRTRDLSGCENGASCEAPLIVAKDSKSPYTCVHPPTWDKQKIKIDKKGTYVRYKK